MVAHMRHLVVHPLTPLIAFSVVLCVLFTTYLALGLAPTDSLGMAASLCWGILFACWIVADARHRKQIPCYDFGFLCYIWLPLAVPWYCIWSRGWRGILVLIAFAGLLLAPYFVGAVVWQFLYGSV